MTRLRIILTPLALLSIAALFLIGGSAGARSAGSDVFGAHVPLARWWGPVWRQFHIEQHLQIRITPGTATMPPAVIEEIEEEERVERVETRKIGKCLGIGSIAEVHPGDGDELLLFLHDDRIVSAKLQKHCSARDFYSGFLIEPFPDGAICPGRDILHSRSGDSCKVRRLHELVPAGSRRIP